MSKSEVELLKRENELLKKEIEILKLSDILFNYEYELLDKLFKVQVQNPNKKVTKRVRFDLNENKIYYVRKLTRKDIMGTRGVDNWLFFGKQRRKNKLKI